MNPNIASSNSAPPNYRQFRRKRVAVLAVMVGAVLVLGPARRADAFLFDIVLDLTALVEHIVQVVQVAQQVESAVQEVKDVVLELTHLGDSVAPDVQAIVAGIEGQFDTNLYNTTSPGNQLNTRYPTDMSNATWTQYQSNESTWRDNERQAVVENRQVENQVYRDMSTTKDQVQSIVDASNSASGETAAVQAHNDLLAVESGELAKLQSLRTARSRLKTEQLARQASELNYAAAEKDRVRAGWDNPAAPTETLVDPFQN
jgi:P-type conjugative transfer protein TrbJ